VQTSELIRHLATGATPVHRLLPPSLRTAMWLGISLPYVCAVVVMKSAAIDFLGKIDARFALEQAAILATSLTAAIAAFASVIPGHHRKIYLLPLLPLAVWLGSLGQGCAHDWLRLGANGPQVRPDWECAPAAIFIGIIPAIAMVVMLRRGAPLAPRVSVTLGALAALGNFGLRIFHIGDVSIMVLVWHLGGLALISVLAGRIGRHVLNWRFLMASAAPRTC
jgi:Negative regulator of sigma F